MKECYQILKKIESHSYMWTGEMSLKSIRTFLDGYSCALYEHNLITSTENEKPNFNDWIANKLVFFESTAGWHNMILAVTIV